MPAAHLELLVEEPSMEAFLREWLPRHLPDGKTFDVKGFQGKTDILAKLEARLRGYKSWIPDDWKIFIIIDRDDDNCVELKNILEGICEKAEVVTRTKNQSSWIAATCLAIEELEAWFFGEWNAVVSAYPKVSPNIPQKAGFRDSDGIAGGTWEALERTLQKHGYHGGGLEKVRAAREIGAIFEANKSTSQSFIHFVNAIDDAFI